MNMFKSLQITRHCILCIKEYINIEVLHKVILHILNYCKYVRVGCTSVLWKTMWYSVI
jgi:hypothetical protein